MKNKKLYFMAFLITLFCFNTVSVAKLINESAKSSEEHKNPRKNNTVFSKYYNLTFKNLSIYDSEIKVVGSDCMYDSGNKNINLKSGGEYNQTIEDSDNANPFHGEFCQGSTKYVIWQANLKKNGDNYEACTFILRTTPISLFSWKTTVYKYYCNLEITAKCSGENCLNVYVDSDKSDHTVISIDNTWEPPEIISSDPQTQAQNNYITITGQGLMKDHSLPYLVTNFDQNKYKVKLIEGKRTQWRAKVWVNCELVPRKISIEGIDNSGITIKGPPCGATITSMKDSQIIPDGKYDISGLINTKTPNDAKKIKVSISSFDDPDYTHPSEPTKEYTPDVDINSGTWSLKGLTAKCFNYYKASVLFNQNRKDDNNLPGKKEIKFGVARCPVKITKPVIHEFITSTDDNPKQIVIEGKVTEKTPLDVIASYYSNGEHVLPILSRIGNNWQTKISDAPAGFIKIKAKNTGTPNVPIKNSNDEVTILKSKDFSVKYGIIDNVFIYFYGTSLPNNDKQTSDFKETLHPKIILSDGVKSEEITPDEKGNWRSDNEYYAKRGVYIFTIHEISDNENYPARKDKTLECTGGNDHMTCIEKNN
ncbi:hypothetical protein [Xenorhabdus stockiae]|uniref:hypothetical protein n=1 Tax=Xenorhabdus stockiae TaxID=351614 RepID=UPI0040638416